MLSNLNWRELPPQEKRRMLAKLQTLDTRTVTDPHPAALTFRGGNKAIAEFAPTLGHNEAIVAGPAETGKTFAVLKRLDDLARTHRGLRGAIVRKVRADMDATVLDIFKREFVEPAGDVHIFGGEAPQFYQYPNGSRVWVAGIDRPGKVLSGALDVIYVNQAEELDAADWETLSTRTTGRAGKLVPGLLFGDANPAQAQHWILDREKSGALTKFESRHEDNPALFDETGSITARGENTLSILDRLTGVRKERLRFGRWVNAEGVVYENYDPAVHVLDYNSPRFPYAAIPATWRRIGAADFGFTNPFSFSWYAFDPDGRMYRYRQIYKTQRLVEDHQRHILYHSMGERLEAILADHDAEDRATLEVARIYYCKTCNVPILNAQAEQPHAKHDVLRGALRTQPAVKEIKRGIQLVTARLNVAGDNKPRFYFMRNALVERDEALAEAHKPLSSEDEMLVYMWEKSADGKPNKEVPHDDDNHGLDELRYATQYADGKKGWARGAAG